MEVIAYIYDSEILCEDCLRAAGIDPDDDEVSALFDTSESDSPLHCAYCHAFLGGSLTEDGFQNIVRYYLDGYFQDKNGDPDDVLLTYMREYDYYDWYVVPTFVGFLDPCGDLKN